MLVANGNKKDDRWHLQMAQRRIIQYNCYLNDARWGRTFVRLCPYFPFDGNGFIKRYVSDMSIDLRTEPASNNVADYGVKKAVESLPQLRLN